MQNSYELFDKVNIFTKCCLETNKFETESQYSRYCKYSTPFLLENVTAENWK